MKIVSSHKHLRISARKVRLVADLVRGKSLDEAKAILKFAVKRATLPMAKLLDQAEANAKKNFQADPSSLYISKVTVDDGPKLRRWRPRARGSAFPIQKKTSHIILVLEGKKGTEKVEEKAVKESKVKEEKTAKHQSFRPEMEAAKPKTEKVNVSRRVLRRKAF